MKDKILKEMMKWKRWRPKKGDKETTNKRQKYNWNRIIQPAPNMGRITSLLSLRAFAASDGKTENPRSFSRRAPHRLFFRPDFRQISCNELIVSQTSSHPIIFVNIQNADCKGKYPIFASPLKFWLFLMNFPVLQSLNSKCSRKSKTSEMSFRGIL